MYKYIRDEKAVLLKGIPATTLGFAFRVRFERNIETQQQVTDRGSAVHCTPGGIEMVADSVIKTCPKFMCMISGSLETFRLKTGPKP